MYFETSRTTSLILSALAVMHSEALLLYIEDSEKTKCLYFSNAG
jgi:hypothetical protein